jgi:hypothetical protein
VNSNLLVGFFLLLTGYVLVDLRMFYVMFILKAPLNRGIFSVHPVELVMMIKTLVENSIDYARSGYYHAASMRRKIILPVALFVSLGGLLSICATAHKQTGALSARIKAAVNLTEGKIKLLYALEFFAVLFACIAGLYDSALLDAFIKKHIPFLFGFNWGRVWIFNRVLWYLILPSACMSQIKYILLVVKKNRYNLFCPMD